MVATSPRIAARWLLLAALALGCSLLLTAQASLASDLPQLPGPGTAGHRLALSRAAAASCGNPGILFCENFDALAPGPAASTAWAADTANGSLTVEPAVPGSHDQVLHVHADDNGHALLRVHVAAPARGFFGRMWVKADAFPAAPDFAHFILVQATGSGSTEMVRPVGGQFVPTRALKHGGTGRSLLGIGADGGPTGDWTDWRESAPALAGGWQCVEWSMQAADNTVRLWINGLANPDLSATTARHGGNAVPFVLPAVTTISIGWWLFQAGPEPASYDLQYDDIALSAARLGCGPAPTT